MTANQPKTFEKLRKEADRAHTVYMNHAARNTPLDPAGRVKAQAEYEQARDKWLDAELRCYGMIHLKTGTGQ